MKIETLIKRAEKLAASITDEMSADEIADIESQHQDLTRKIEFERHFQPQESELGLPSTGSEANRRSAVLTALSERDAANPTFGHVTLEPASIRDAMADGLLARIMPSHTPTIGRAYAGLTIPELARHAVAQHQNVSGMSAGEVVSAALGRGMGGLHSTSDFPAILGNDANKILQQGYQAAPSALKQVARRATARDFRAKRSINLSAFEPLERVNEHGEYKRGTFEEGAESYQIGTFGKIFGITRQALVNDDLGAFEAIPSRLGEATAAFEAKFLADLLEGNPNLADGKAVFHVDHGNLASGAGITVESLSAARLMMRQQRGLAGEVIAVAPSFLIVPSALETAAEKVLAEIQATTTDSANPFSGRLTLIVEPRLEDAGAWYLAANPAAVPMLEYSYLEGTEGARLDSRFGFDTDGVEFKVSLDYGAGFLGYVGMVKTPAE